MSENKYARYPSLEGMPVIISGGANGIGAQLVRSFAAQGAKVGFVDLAKDDGEALAAELAGSGQVARFIPCDITNIPAYQRAIVDFAETHGDALTLINNAGNDKRHDWQDVTPDFWDGRMAVNLKHAFFAAQAVAPGMARAGKGSILNMGSISWMVGVGNMPGYTTAKAALQGLARTLARDMGGDNIRVNIIVPGAIITEQQLQNRLSQDDLDNIDRAQFLTGHLGPSDVARMALFLAADDSAMITGQEFLVDGGWAHG